MKESEDEDFKNVMMFQLLAYTGMRKGEMLGLRWSDIDFKMSVLNVNQALALGHHEQILQSPKTFNSRRTIGLDTETTAMLKKWRSEQKNRMIKLGYNTLQPEQLVFTSKTNNFVDLNRPNRILKRILKYVDLPYMTVHGFRHTHCSLLLDAGVDIREAKERLGHADVQTTINIYAPVSEAKRDEATKLFSDFMSQ